MRLLFVSLNFAPEPTATGKYTGEMAKWFADRGHDVEVIAGLPHYPQWKVWESYRRRGFRREQLEGVSVMRAPHSVPDAANVSSLARITMESSFTLASLWWWSRLLIRRRRFDVVIAVCPPMQDALVPWLYGLLRRVPWVFHVQDFQVDAAMRLNMLKGKVLGRALYSIENFFLSRATAVSSITPAMCRRAIEKGAKPDNTWCVPNWADIDSVVPGPHVNEFREELGVSSEQILVMYAGGLGTKQGLEVVLTAASMLGDDKRFQFVLIGGGSAREGLLRQARELHLDNLEFLELQPKERLPAMLTAADIHLVIQRRNAADLVMPSKLTNILAAGRPTIATAEQGTALWDVLEDEGAGRCVAPEDPEALVVALREVADSKERREAMGQNARRYAEANLGQNAILERFETRLYDLVNHNEVKA